MVAQLVGEDRVQRRKEQTNKRAAEERWHKDIHSLRWRPPCREQTPSKWEVAQELLRAVGEVDREAVSAILS
jgi:hypothetical protein